MELLLRVTGHTVDLSQPVFAVCDVLTNSLTHLLTQVGFILFDSVMENYSYFLPRDIKRNMSSTAVLKIVKAFVQIKDNIESKTRQKKERKKKADRNKRKLLFYPRMPWESCPGTND